MSGSLFLPVTYSSCCLIGRHDKYLGYLHMSRSRCCVIYHVSNVVACQRTDSFVYGVSFILISPEAYNGKVCLDHAGLDVGDTYRCIYQINPKTVGQGFYSSFGCTLPAASCIGCIAGNGSDIDDMSAASFHHSGNNQTRHGQ